MESSLQGKLVLITREESQAKSFSDIILNHGGTPIEVPLLKINCQNRSREEMKDVSQYEWVFFTSANGVHCFFQMLKEHNLMTEMNSTRVAVVGHKTEEALKTYGFEAEFIPSVYNAETMANEFMKIYPKENKGPLLLIRGNISRPTLPTEFKKHGYDVDLMEVYETVHHVQMKEELNIQLKNHKINFITFTSPSTVQSFMELIDHPVSEIDSVCVCIGTTTEKAAQLAGFKNTLIPETYTIEGMVEQMIEYVNRKG